MTKSQITYTIGSTLCTLSAWIDGGLSEALAVAGILFILGTIGFGVVRSS